MDILLLFEYPTLCGGEQSMLCLLPSLQAAGCRLRAAAPREGLLASALIQQGVEVLPIALHESSGVRRPLDVCRAELAQLLACTRPELLHANSLSMARLAGPVAAEIGLPSVGHIRDIVKLSRRAIDDVNCHTSLLAVSKAVRDFHVAQGVEARRLSVLYNGVDLEVFRPCAATGYLQRELNLPAEARLLAAIGQLGPRKGLDQLLLSMRQVVERWPEAHLLLIGQRLSTKDEGVEYERALHHMADEAPLAGHVHFLGWRTDIAKLLPELTLLVHAARQEPLGRVLLEAAACGCAIVATDVGGTREIFEDSMAGAILVRPNDPQAMADAILRAPDPSVSKLNYCNALRLAERFAAASAGRDLASHWESTLTPPGRTCLAHLA